MGLPIRTIPGITIWESTISVSTIWELTHTMWKINFFLRQKRLGCDDKMVWGKTRLY
jgi:hypothetical protein